MRKGNRIGAVSYTHLDVYKRQVDNGAYLRDIRVDRAADWSIGWENGLGVQALSCTGWRRRLDPAAPLYAPLQDDLEPASLKWIPYFAFANRGETEMIVWVQVR